MKNWQFVQVENGAAGAWTWRVVATSTGIETASHPHSNYGAAVMDAIRHGFQPGTDQWVVVTQAGTTRFEPSGTAPEREKAERAQSSRPAAEAKGIDL